MTFAFPLTWSIVDLKMLSLYSTLMLKKINNNNKTEQKKNKLKWGDINANPMQTKIHSPEQKVHYTYLT
jgi:hypothetical protein